MAAAEIVQSLSYMMWALLGALALGSFAMCWLLRQTSDATPGFLGFTAFTAATLGLLWLLTELSLPAPSDLVIVAAPEWDEPRRLAIALFTLLAAVSGIGMRRGAAAVVTGALALAAGGTAMAIGAVGWSAGPFPGLPLLVQLLALSAVTGGSLAAVILAHWYLVTPRISDRPLVLATRLLFWALLIQLLLFVAWQATGAPAGRPFAGLTGPQALFVWLRLSVGLVFPLVLVAMAYRTALTRSMELATGLLYIELAAVLASTIVAAALALSVGVLV